MWNATCARRSPGSRIWPGRRGSHSTTPEISIRTGDTSQKERSRFRRHPAEILITTPESLYLLLTSDAAASLRRVDTVIIDEIHAVVPTKRGAHLALSLERLEAITEGRVQRIGLSATQRPLEEVAHFLGGASRRSRAEALKPRTLAVIAYRPVTIVDASEPKRLDLRIEVPVEDMARMGQREELPSGAASQGPKRTSIWTAIHPRLVEIVRQRHSTIIFVNSRRIAERLAGAINELAGEQLARAHHGSLAAAQRSEIEEQLKAGRLRALVATSSLELGIDMGAVDLVVQIEAPPSVASAMQRIGRAGHHVGAASEGVIFPKYRADLVACAAVTRAMHEGLVESTRFLRNPLDVLAQQIVAIVAQPPPCRLRPPSESSRRSVEIGVEEVFRLVRGAAPFSSLTRTAFTGVLDLLAGRYPSDEFADLRPRITWDRVRDTLAPREGAKMLAILNGGTIPDRGLYGVFLSGAEGKPVRVGELDEEMVFESRTGDTFILGASTWRIDEITHDRVLVSPAPGQPGKMPFWHGDNAGRPLEFGRRIGQLVRELRDMPRNAALSRLTREHDLDTLAAENLIRFLADQEIATTAVPDDRTIVIERTRDEMGDWRVCVLTPFGSRIHAPWAMAITGRIRASGGADVEAMWGDDGFVLRFPDSDAPPDSELILLDAEEATDLVLRQLSGTALFAAKFRESAARALLLPRRRAQGRAPLWQQRKRAYDLLAVASRYPSFPILLEAYRECMRDVFDMPALLETLRAIRQRNVRVHVADTRTPSPFASSLLFSYVANYIYDGDAPLAERRAQALSIDQEQLRDLLGDADLRELLDADAISEVEEQLQGLLETQRVRSADGIHDLLLRIGDLSREELLAPSRRPRAHQSTGSAASRAPPAGDQDSRRKAADRRRRCGSLSRCAGHSASPGNRARPAAAGSGAGARTGSPLRPDPRALHPARSHRPLCAGCAAGGKRLAGVAARRPHRGRRIPSRRRLPRVVRRRGVAPDPAQVAGPAAPRGRAHRAAGTGAAGDPLAGCAAAQARSRCLAGHHRASAGRAAGRLAGRNFHPARAPGQLLARQSGHLDCRR